jgi:hypothetical protein
MSTPRFEVQARNPQELDRAIERARQTGKAMTMAGHRVAVSWRASRVGSRSGSITPASATWRATAC